MLKCQQLLTFSARGLQNSFDALLTCFQGLMKKDRKSFFKFGVSQNWNSKQFLLEDVHGNAAFKLCKLWHYSCRASACLPHHIVYFRLI